MFALGFISAGSVETGLNSVFFVLLHTVFPCGLLSPDNILHLKIPIVNLRPFLIASLLYAPR